MQQAVQQNKAPLKLLLFIDGRPGSTEQVDQIRQHLEQLDSDAQLSLETVAVSEQPYLAEHFKLVATPALVKLSDAGHQMLAGSDIISQIDHWWPRWQLELEAQQARAQAVSDSDSDSEAMLGTAAHSAEIIRLSDEIFRIKQLNAELQAQLRFKNRIIAMMAHDLRNPLTAASIAVETLEMGHAPDGSRSKQLSLELTLQLLKHAKTQIRNINRMITDILQAAHGPFAELQMQPKKVDLQALCLDVLTAMNSKIAEQQQVVTTDIPPDLPHVYADPGQIRRVITNLLDNAVKYTPEAGQIEIRALHRTTQKVQMTIRDTGPGIPDDQKAQIFEESFRLQRDQSQDGYGLGLALCLRIIRAHYGQIWVDSQAGEGSAFNFTLPVYKAYGMTDESGFSHQR
ncbi:MAG: histidine kinase [Leptolyngbya sp. SIO4C1]|nr:histidine kinase [Leptolyngbya sp. SIO4C1]